MWTAILYGPKCIWQYSHVLLLNYNYHTAVSPTYALIITLRPRQNGRHFADDIFKCIFLKGNTSISINISLKFVTEGRINNILPLVQIMAWRRLGDKPLSEPMMVSLLTHICVTRPQWVKWIKTVFCISSNRTIRYYKLEYLVHYHCYIHYYHYHHHCLQYYYTYTYMYI